jgi:hypothetical protein
MNSMKLVKRKLFGAVIVGLMALVLSVPLQAADIPSYDGDKQVSDPADIPITKPNIEVTALTPWVTDTVTSALTLTPDNYKDQLKKISGNFTKKGWEKFTMFLQSANIIGQVQNGSIDSEVLVGNPIVASEGVREGVYQWSVTMSARIGYIQNNQGKDETNEMTTLNIAVRRVPKADNVLGIQVDDWVQQ